MSKRKSFILIAIISLLGILLSISANLYFYYKTEKLLLKNDAYLIHRVLELHPEMEESLINITLDSFQVDDQILKDHGISPNTVSFLISDQSLKKDMLWVNVIILTIILFSIFFIFFLYRRKEKKKMLEIEKYMNEILNDHYSLDIRDYEEDSLSHLKNAIYKVTIKLKEAKEMSLKDKLYLEETLQDISHQLKTPLTSMYVMNELLGKNLSVEKRKELLAKNEEQLQRIEWLITSLLKISMLDSGTVTFHPQKVSLKELVEKSCEPLKIPIELKGLELVIDVDSSIQLSVDFNWMREALVNMIKNAYEHTEHGGIYIAAKKNPIYTELTIRDTGCGIRKEDIHHIFERFYRSSSNQKDSIGIGLNMSKKIIDLQNGEVSVKSRVGETIFTIHIYH